MSKVFNNVVIENFSKSKIILKNLIKNDLNDDVEKVVIDNIESVFLDAAINAIIVLLELLTSILVDLEGNFIRFYVVEKETSTLHLTITTGKI